MRPPKVILLVGDDEEQLGLLSFLLRINGYRVIVSAAGSLGDAQGILSGQMSIDLLIAVQPLENAEELFAGFKRIRPHLPTLVLAQYEKVLFGSNVDSVLFVSKSNSAAILDRVKILTVRKRGPRRPQ